MFVVNAIENINITHSDVKSMRLVILVLHMSNENFENISCARFVDFVRDGNTGFITCHAKFTERKIENSFPTKRRKERHEFILPLDTIGTWDVSRFVTGSGKRVIFSSHNP